MKKIRLRFYDAVAAEKDGVKPSFIDKIIMFESHKLMKCTKYIEAEKRR